MKARHACICVGADHWAARREQVSFFGHSRRIRTAYQRCVQVAALYEALGRACAFYAVAVTDGERRYVTDRRQNFPILVSGRGLCQF